MASEAEPQPEHHVRRELRIDGVHCLTFAALCAHRGRCAHLSSGGCCQRSVLAQRDSDETLSAGRREWNNQLETIAG